VKLRTANVVQTNGTTSRLVLDGLENTGQVVYVFRFVFIHTLIVFVITYLTWQICDVFSVVIKRDMMSGILKHGTNFHVFYVWINGSVNFLFRPICNFSASVVYVVSVQCDMRALQLYSLLLLSFLWWIIKPKSHQNTFSCTKFRMFHALLPFLLVPLLSLLLTSWIHYLYKLDLLTVWNF